MAIEAVRSSEWLRWLRGTERLAHWNREPQGIQFRVELARPKGDGNALSGGALVLARY